MTACLKSIYMSRDLEQGGTCSLVFSPYLQLCNMPLKWHMHVLCACTFTLLLSIDSHPPYGPVLEDNEKHTLPLFSWMTIGMKPIVRQRPLKDQYQVLLCLTD